MTIIRGFQKPLHNVERCRGCGMLIGGETGLKVGYDVKDGDVKGLFHSRACYENAVKKHNKKEEVKE